MVVVSSDFFELCWVLWMVSGCPCLSFVVSLKAFWALGFALGERLWSSGDIRAISQGLPCGCGSCGGYLGYCLLLGTSPTAVFQQGLSLWRIYASWPQCFYVARVVFQKPYVLLANRSISATIATLSTKGMFSFWSPKKIRIWSVYFILLSLKYWFMFFINFEM